MQIKIDRGVPQGLAPANNNRMAKRVLRKPVHTHQVRSRPWQIQPFCIAPVLPGETLKNLRMQSRVVSDPIKNPLIGWWKEYYYFYVPLRATLKAQGDHETRTTVEDMLMDVSAPLSDDSAVGAWAYHANGTDWVTPCLNVVVDQFFRDEGEAVSGNHFDFGDGIPLASKGGNSFLDSYYPNSEMPAPDTVDVDVGGNDDFDIAELQSKFETWQLLRSQTMMKMDFEDWLETYGIQQQQRNDPLKAELIRTFRDWSYPTNTVNPADVVDSEDTVIVPAGAPSSALSWSIAGRADKDRFFREPGFIIGVTIARPKVYMSNQTSNASCLLQGVLDWMPALLKDEVYTSIKRIAQGEGPLSATEFAATDYWLDVRDLFSYGDQFVNFALTETDAGLVALPDAAGHSESRFVSSADTNALFVSESSNLVREDGITTLGILGTQVDHT